MTLALLGLLATVNPAAAALALRPDRRADRPLPVLVGAVVAAVVLVALAAGGDAVVDALDVNLGTYRLGAGVVVGAAGLRWLVAGPAEPAEEPDADRTLAAFVAFPALVTPGAAALAVSVGAEEDLAVAAVAVAVAVALGALALHLRRSLPAALLPGLVRLLGGAAAVVGVLVAVDGVKTL